MSFSAEHHLKLKSGSFLKGPLSTRHSPPSNMHLCPFDLSPPECTRDTTAQRRELKGGLLGVSRRGGTALHPRPAVPVSGFKNSPRLSHPPHTSTTRHCERVPPAAVRPLHKHLCSCRRSAVLSGVTQRVQVRVRMRV